MRPGKARNEDQQRSWQQTTEINLIQALIASALWPELGHPQQQHWLQQLTILKNQQRKL